MSRLKAWLDANDQPTSESAYDNTPEVIVEDNAETQTIVEEIIVVPEDELETDIVTKVITDGYLDDIRDDREVYAAEVNEMNDAIVNVDDMTVILNVAEDEEKENGVVSTETALKVVNQYNKLVSKYGDGNFESITIETATKYSSESYEVSKQGSVTVISKIKEIIKKIIDKVLDMIKALAVKVYVVFNKLEFTAKELARSAGADYTDVKIDKYKTRMDVASIVGRVAILNDLSIGELNKYIHFINNTFMVNKLVTLYDNSLMNNTFKDLKLLKDMPSIYKFDSYFVGEIKDINRIVPMTIYGKKATVLVSYIDKKDPKDIKLVLKKAEVDIIPNPKLKVADVILRKDIISAANTISTTIKSQRDSVKKTLDALGKMKNTADKLGGSDEIISEAGRMTSMITNLLYESVWNGAVANNLIVRLLSEHLSYYRKHNVVKK